MIEMRYNLVLPNFNCLYWQPEYDLVALDTAKKCCKLSRLGIMTIDHRKKHLGLPLWTPDICNLNMQFYNVIKLFLVRNSQP